MHKLGYIQITRRKRTRSLFCKRDFFLLLPSFRPRGNDFVVRDDVQKARGVAEEGRETMGNPVYVCPLQGRTALLLIPPFQGLQVNYNAALPIRDPSIPNRKMPPRMRRAAQKTRH